MERFFLETKFSTDDAGAITGLAWPFETPDRVGDMIVKGAFAGVRVPLPMLFAHDQNEPIGAWTLAEEKADGLYLSGNMLINDVVRAKEVNALVKAGAVPGISIGFITKKSVSRKGGGRTITQLELLEASLCAVPMHAGARIISAKSAVQALAIASILNRATAQITGSQK